MKRLHVDFANTLLALVVRDMESILEHDGKSCSFIRYFQSFVCTTHTAISGRELGNLMLLVFGLFRLDRNDRNDRSDRSETATSACAHAFNDFIDAFLSASSRVVTRLWPVLVLLLLSVSRDDGFIPSDNIWFKIFQLLKHNANHGSNLLNDAPQMLLARLGGTLFNPHATDSSLDYDFDEDLSIEHDQIVRHLLRHFHPNSGALRQYIVMDADGIPRLGPYFIKDSLIDDHIDHAHGSPPTEPLLSPMSTRSPSIAQQCNLDESIEQLRGQLESLAAQVPASTSEKAHIISVQSSLFVVDTNALLGNDSVLRDQICNYPSRFMIPLLVMAEIERLMERGNCAVAAADFVHPLIAKGVVSVVNNSGRIIHPEEYAQQLTLLKSTPSCRTNDDVIVELSATCTIGSLTSILITDDVSMRLKAASRGIHSLSVKEFRRLCNR